MSETTTQPEVTKEAALPAQPPHDPILEVLVPIFTVATCFMVFPAGFAFQLLAPDMSRAASIFVIGLGGSLWCTAVAVFGLMVLRLGQLAQPANGSTR